MSVLHADYIAFWSWKEKDKDIEDRFERGNMCLEKAVVKTNKEMTVIMRL